MSATLGSQRVNRVAFAVRGIHLRGRWHAWAVAAGVLMLLALAVARVRNAPLPAGAAHTPVEARFAPGGAPAPILRSGLVEPARGELDELLELEQRVVADPSPSNLRRFGVALLAAGRPEPALDALREASRLRPGQSAILADVAAAELALGRLFDAAEHSAAVLDRDPHNQTAAFNWALALEELANRPSAIDAWKQYLTIDPYSDWSVKARGHLDALQQPPPTWERDRGRLRPGLEPRMIHDLVSEYPQRSRARSHNILLPQWIVSRKPEELALLRQIAAERETDGDAFLHDVVEHAAAHPDEDGVGILKMKEGYDVQTGSNPDFVKAGALYDQAVEALVRSGSPYAITAEISSATMNNYRSQADLVLAKLDRVDAWLAAAGNRYPSMAAEALWSRGMSYGQNGQPFRALRTLRQAATEARRAGERENEVALESLIAEQLELTGDPEEAESARMEALRHLAESHSHPQRQYVGHATTGLASIRAGRPHVALAFIDAQALIAHKLNQPMLVAESESSRGMALLMLGRRDEALAHIDASQTLNTGIKAVELGDRTRADAEYYRGKIEQAEHLPQAIEAYSSSIVIGERHGWRVHLARTRLARGEALRAAGDLAGAERDFRAGIADVEDQRKDIGEADSRIAYFERADGLFDRLVELLVDDGRTEEALTVSEQKRARLLLDRVAITEGDAATPRTGRQIAAGVARNARLIEWTLLDRGAEIWVAGGGTVSHHRSTATGREIKAAIDSHLAAIAAHDPDMIRTQGRWLFDQLIAPIADELPAGSDLVLVADDALQSFPFATLVAPDGTFLMESHALATSPSASIYLLARKSAATDAVIAVAEPAPAGLALLPNAISEARAVAGGHGGDLRVGDQVTPADFLRLASDTAVAHFAGHAATDFDQPAQSALLFETANGEAARLTAKEIAHGRLRTHPLVVLNACSTGRGKLRRNEGVDSLAAAFLQAGARGVVATLWDVDDAPSATLFRLFHQRLREGARAADALRDAQRTMSRSSNPRERSPSSWGGAAVIGTM